MKRAALVLALAWALPLAGQESGAAYKLDTVAVRIDAGAGGFGSSSPGGSDTHVQFNDGGSFGGNAYFTYTKSVGALTLTAAGDGAVLTTRAYSSGTSNIFQWQKSDNTALGAITHDGRISVTGASVATDGTGPALGVTATLPASPSAAVSGVNVAVTSAGSAAQNQRGASFTIAAGYTGDQWSHGIFAKNTVKGTGNLHFQHASYGVYGEATETLMSAFSVGVGGFAGDGAGAPAIGVYGRALGATDRVHVGVLGKVQTGQGIGVMAVLSGSPVQNILASVNALPYTALLANNGLDAAPIAIFQDNGVTVFSVEDGGGNYRQRKVTANTGTATPDGTVSDVVYTNEGDGDGSTITLPTAAANLTYTVYVQAAQTITITANSGDTIRIAGNVTAAAGSITSNVVGSSVTLVAINATEWVAVASLGSWTF